jgi:hypothetical protein
MRRWLIPGGILVVVAGAAATLFFTVGKWLVVEDKLVHADVIMVLSGRLGKGGTEVDYQVAAPTEMRTPNLHQAINRSIKECGWKDGDRGGPAQMQNLL